MLLTSNSKERLPRLARDAELALPTDLDYQAIHGLSWEEKAILSETRPESLAQARRIEGVTPSATLRLLAFAKQARKDRHGDSVVVRGLPEHASNSVTTAAA